MKGSLIAGSPWYKLFVVFALTIASTALISFVAVLSIPLFFNIEYSELLKFIHDDGFFERVDILLYMQGVSTIGTFLIPAMVASYLISPYPSAYLGLEVFPKKAGLIIILLLVLTLSGTVISDSLYKLSTAIPFPESWSGLKEYLDGAQNAMEDQMASFLNMQNPSDFLMVLMVMAVLPAVCEESLFRGILQPLFIRACKSAGWGIIISSLLFGLLHQQFYSFLSIFALSVVLGYLRFWTKSLWVSVVMHFFNNASIVIAIYFFDLSLDELSSSSNSWDLFYISAGVMVFSLCLFALYKFSREKELV